MRQMDQMYAESPACVWLHVDGENQGCVILDKTDIAIFVFLRYERIQEVAPDDLNNSTSITYSLEQVLF